MAEQSAGSIVYEISADVAPLLQAGKESAAALKAISASAQNSGRILDSLDQSSAKIGKSFGALNSYTKSMDGSLKQLNLSVSSIAKAMTEAARGSGGASDEFSHAKSIIESLGNQIAILEEAQENGARSAATLAAQIRAGSKATDEEKQKIAQLTGQLFDMKKASDTSVGGNKGWRSSMQQAGYQVQDFIVQVQGGQSALVAFSQQGSQLAGAFGPGGAVVGAVLALSSVLAGVLITALNGGKSAMDALKDAADAMDKVITVSAQGVAALSDKYALLARTNAEVATLMRNQALLEYNDAIKKIPKGITDASDSLLSLGDKALSAFAGGYASVKGFNDRLATLEITTGNFSEAMDKAYKAGLPFQSVANSIGNTVGAVATKFGISDQKAFEFTKRLSDIAKNPSPEALQKLALELQHTQSSTEKGQAALTEFVGKLVELSQKAVIAKSNMEALKGETDNLTSGQKGLIQQSQRNLALSKLQGEARAKLQAQYAAEDAGFAANDPHTQQMVNDAAATYKNTEAQRELQSQLNKSKTAAETAAQRLEVLKQQSELSAASTKELSREQAILNAQQSLGKGATKGQLAEAAQYAAAKWDTANALKAQAAAEKLLPETKENVDYSSQRKALDSLKNQRDSNGKLIVSQEQYNQASERLEAQHQINLAKIRANQVVTPQQAAAGTVDPVQQLANENAQKLALIQQFETQKGQLTNNGIALMNAANTQYEQARIAAAWEIYSNQSMANQMLADAIDSLQGGATNAITGLINGTQTLQQAFANIGSTILNSVVSAFVQMGIDWVKSSIMGSTAQSAAIATTTAAQTASLATTTTASTAAAGETAAAWAPAATAASVGSFGGAATLGIAALVAAMAIGVGLAGRRKNGGPVSAGSMYQVGEGGMPEIYRASNGSQYMIPGDNGSVISNKDMQGGAGGGSVVNQQVTFNIQTTGGVDDATMAKMADMMRKVSLSTIRDQQRPNGLLNKGR